MLGSTQREFFDHRLRKDESHDEKWKYIKMNPVRAGLTHDPEAWPYVYEPANPGRVATGRGRSPSCPEATVFTPGRQPGGLPLPTWPSQKAGWVNVPGANLQLFKQALSTTERFFESNRGSGGVSLMEVH
jgi:hypothetical protein